MNYKFKEQKDGIIFIEEDDKVIAKYKLNDRYREVNYAFKGDVIKIRLFDRYKKYIDAEVKLNVDEVQMIP